MSRFYSQDDCFGEWRSKGAHYLAQDFLSHILLRKKNLIQDFGKIATDLNVH